MLQTRKAPHWVVNMLVYECRVLDNLCYKHGKPNTGWSIHWCTSAACSTIYVTNTESPTVGGRYVGVRASCFQKFTTKRKASLRHMCCWGAVDTCVTDTESLTLDGWYVTLLKRKATVSQSSSHQPTCCWGAADTCIMASNEDTRQDRLRRRRERDRLRRQMETAPGRKWGRKRSKVYKPGH